MGSSFPPPTPLPVSFLTNAAAVTAAVIPSAAAGGPAAIRTLGYLTAGDYGSATYTRVSSGGQLTSADGQSWQIADLEPYANAFGATGDGTTDDTLAIQACLDFVENTGRYKARLAPGKYKTTTTIQVGHGWGPTSGRFCRVCLEGETGFTPGAFGSKNPTQILPTFQDRPVINIQGNQKGGIRYLQITGPGTLAGVTAFGNYTGWGVKQFFDQTNYIPFLGGVACAQFQHSPFCGVSIDAYYQAAPANPYPAITYPSWVTTPPPAAPYGVFQSTDCFVEHCTIDNTLIGIMNQPNGVGNGDFMKFNDNNINGCLIGISIGGSQARITHYDRCNFAGCYTCIDAVNFGSSGNISGSMDNMHANYCYQLLFVTGNWAKGVNVTNFYSEVMTRIGASIGTPCNVTFQDSWFTCNNFASTTDVLAIPVYEGTGYAKFLNCRIVGQWGATIIAGNASFEGLTTQLSAGPADPLEVQAYKFMKSVLSNGFLANATRNQFLDCSINGSVYTGYGTSVSNANYWHDVGWVGLGQLNYSLSGHQSAAQLSVSSVVWTNRTFTGTLNVGYAAVGDVMFSATVGWFVLTAVAGTAISATMISNYQLTGGVYTMLVSNGFGVWSTQTDAQMNTSFASLSPWYFPINIFDWNPPFNLFWKTTLGSNVLNCVTSNGAANNIPSGITTASKVLWTNNGSTLAPGLPFGNTTSVTAVAAQSITMSSNALISGTWLITPFIARAA